MGTARLGAELLLSLEYGKNLCDKGTLRRLDCWLCVGLEDGRLDGSWLRVVERLGARLFEGGTARVIVLRGVVELGLVSGICPGKGV